MTELAVKAQSRISLPSDQDSSGRTLGQEELEQLRHVIESGTLTCTKGTACATLEKRFADMLGAKFAIACASGSAAIHTAIAAIDPEPGDEIITTSITDMGALTPILYQGAIPVFADVDPYTCNVTAETIAARISERTRAIIVTHLFGNPCEMKDIVALAAQHNLPIIEDCAQAYLARYDDQYVGTIGAIGCFSLQQGKHITTGEGGLVVSNDPDYARRVRLYVNKAWGYGDANPDHYFLALNYRLTELQGAVAVAQLAKLQDGVDQRRAMAARLTKAISGLDGVSPPAHAEGSVHTYWRYCVWVDGSKLPGGSPALGAGLKQYGIAAAPRYIQKPAFRCQVLRDQCTFGKSRFPFTLARPEAVDYDAALFPGTFQGLDEILVLPWNERFTEAHVDFIADAIRAEHARLCK
ncbi:DegT/DnrJ/EryC1/StrS family aminotransferase [Defluviicoccus vanus]|uniref:DegT/DnrJ/EryC1/StrS family aminotransferase n=1 Tax=Defluviicoccus vanus TaxID=111831 RepID=UPI001CBA6130|nr:DegT/DnrJ/EryC1/StrS family aminotransferase [Defluviicoccus vanus]